MKPDAKYYRRYSALASILVVATLFAGASAGETGTTVAVLDFEANNASAADAAVLTELVRSALVNTHAITLVDKKNMQAILSEQAFQQTGCTTEVCAVKLGRLLNVRKIIIGNYSVLGDNRYLMARVVDVETGKVEQSATEKGFGLDSADRAATALAASLFPTTPSSTIAESPPVSTTGYQPPALSNPATPPPAPPVSVGSEPDRYDYLFDGFERELLWEASTGTAATGRILDPAIATEGRNSLKLTFKSVAPAGKAICYRSLTADWSPFGALLVDIYNPTDLPNLKVGIMIVTTGRWLAHEFITTPLAKGWNRNVRVDLKGRCFSSVASDFQPTGFLAGRGEVQSLQIIAYPGEAAEGEINIDNIRLERAGIVTAGPFALNTTVDLTASAGKLDYLPPGMRIRQRDLVPIESFEGPLGGFSSWQSEIVTGPATDYKSHGSTALEVSFPSSPDGFHLNLAGLEARLVGTKQVRMDVYCPGPGAQIALYLHGNDGSTYYSEPSWIGHGWNTRVFDFTNQNDWSGGVVDESVLSDLTSVDLLIISRTPGRLTIDDISAGTLTLKGAGRAGALLSASFNPAQNFEIIADYRAEDTAYGSSASDIHSPGAEGWLDAGSIRWDSGGFRTSALYRRRVSTMDQPVHLLLSPHALGTNITGVETAGSVLGFEVQGMAASKLEYERYNRHAPTGLGPETVAEFRIRRTVAEATRVGITSLIHRAKYGTGVTGYPELRNTWGADAETRVEAGKKFSVNGSVEGGVTAGDRNIFDPTVPENDQFFGAANVSPEMGRLKLSYGYSLFGYYFDADLSVWGSGWAGHDVSATLNLDGLWPAQALATIPVYDRSLGNNLEVVAFGTIWESRDRYTDSGGQLKPRTTGKTGSVSLLNDDKARPHFSVGLNFEESTNEWERVPELEELASLRVPLPWDTAVTVSLEWEQNESHDPWSSEHDHGWKQIQQVSVEKYFKFNLFLNVYGQAYRSQKSDEGVWDEPDQRFKLMGGARQDLGPNTTIELLYGSPALLGTDFGLQTTINVWTLTLKSYF